MRSGDAFNVVPAAGELCATSAPTAWRRSIPYYAALPTSATRCGSRRSMVRAWPGMDSREATAEVREAASEALGRPIAGSERGGASDASHVAAGGVA